MKKIIAEIYIYERLTLGIVITALSIYRALQSSLASRTVPVIRRPGLSLHVAKFTVKLNFKFLKFVILLNTFLICVLVTD